jgi:hypothetical protein
MPTGADRRKESGHRTPDGGGALDDIGIPEAKCRVRGEKADEPSGIARVDREEQIFPPIAIGNPSRCIGIKHLPSLRVSPPSLLIFKG